MPRLKNPHLHILIYLCAVILASCNQSRRSSNIICNGSDFAHDTLLYASGIQIRHLPKYTRVDIRDPWDTLQILNTYILVQRDESLPKNLPQGTIVRIPIEKAIVYTSVHAAIIEELGSIDQIAGICEPQYITSHAIHERINQGQIADLGESTSPNIEKIIQCGGEVIICSPFENGGYGPVEKLGIPIIEGADYMEHHPLGRTEWIRFYGLLMGKSEKADSLLLSTVNNYNKLKELVAVEDAARPTLLAERRYGSAWFIPGGKSYVSIMYQDAGANYIFSNQNETGSIPLSFETVLQRGMHSDYWLMKYALDRPMTYDDLLFEYPNYECFDAFKNRHIYTCNTLLTTYYNDITIHPDYILADLIHIFHPNLLPSHKLQYFLPMPSNSDAPLQVR